MHLTLLERALAVDFLNGIMSLILRYFTKLSSFGGNLHQSG